MKTIVDLVEGVGGEVHGRTIDDEEVSVDKDSVIDSIEDCIAEGLTRVVLVNGMSSKGEGVAIQVGKECDVQTNVEPMSRENVDSAVDWAEDLFGREICREKS